VVTNFFLTLYWSKRFKDLRKTTLASVNPVPQIFVNDTSSEPSIPQITLNSSGPVTPPPAAPPPEPPTGPPEGSASGYSPVEFSFAGVDPFSDDSPSVLRQRPGRRTPPSSSSPFASPGASPNISPSASPRITATHTGGWFGGAGQQSQSTLQTQQQPGAGRERVGSDVAPVRGLLDDIEEGEWKDQIRSFIEGRASTDGGRPPQ